MRACLRVCVHVRVCARAHEAISKWPSHHHHQSRTSMVSPTYFKVQNYLLLFSLTSVPMLGTLTMREPDFYLKNCSCSSSLVTNAATSCSARGSRWEQGGCLLINYPDNQPLQGLPRISIRWRYGISSQLQHKEQHSCQASQARSFWVFYSL